MAGYRTPLKPSSEALQRAINIQLPGRLKVDGKVGPRTRYAFDGLSPTQKQTTCAAVNAMGFDLPLTLLGTNTSAYARIERLYRSLRQHQDRNSALNVLAQCALESGANPASREMPIRSHRTACRLPLALARSMTAAQWEDLVSRPFEYFEKMYGWRSAKGPAFNHYAYGDGYKYRGNSFIQITGKANHAAVSTREFNYVDQPESMGTYDGAVAAMLKFLELSKADLRNVDSVSRAINGGMSAEHFRHRAVIASRLSYYVV